MLYHYGIFRWSIKHPCYSCPVLELIVYSSNYLMVLSPHKVFIINCLLLRPNLAPRSPVVFDVQLRYVAGMSYQRPVLLANFHILLCLLRSAGCRTWFDLTSCMPANMWDHHRSPLDGRDRL